MEETWEQWKPHENLSPQYIIESIRDDLDDFRILLTDEQDSSRQLWIVYDKSVRVYRKTDESYRLATIAHLNKKYGSNFYSQWTFFKVHDSSYIEWLYDQSFETFPRDWYMHFAFIDDDAIVDVVSTYEPSFEFVQR